MKASKIFSQKGQGLLEYALLFGFVVAVFLIGFSEGGFGDTIGNLFGSSSESVASVEFDGGKSGGSSSSSGASSNSNSTSATPSASSETSTAEKSTPVTFKPLNWVQDVIPFANISYDTIANSRTPDDALRSEIGFFDTLLTFVDGGLASTNAADGTKDWESFLSMVKKTRKNIPASYVRDEQKITVKTVGKDLRITYSDKEGNYYYKLSPDANNVMQIETNTHKSYSEFFSSIKKNADGGGWKYGD